MREGAPCSNRQAIFFQLETPGRFEAAHTKSQHIIPKVARSLSEILREIVFLDPHPSRMRDYVYAKDDVIKEDGSNLSAVLYKIANAEQGIAPFLDFIRSLPEQAITDVQFIKTDRNDLMVRLVESFGDQQRQAEALDWLRGLREPG